MSECFFFLFYFYKSCLSIKRCLFVFKVAHMTKNELDYLDTALVGPAMLFLNQYFNFFFDEYYVLWACLVGLVKIISSNKSKKKNFFFFNLVYIRCIWIWPRKKKRNRFPYANDYLNFVSDMGDARSFKIFNGNLPRNLRSPEN